MPLLVHFRKHHEHKNDIQRLATSLKSILASLQWHGMVTQQHDENSHVKLLQSRRQGERPPILSLDRVSKFGNAVQGQITPIRNSVTKEKSLWMKILFQLNSLNNNKIFSRSVIYKCVNIP